MSTVTKRFRGKKRSKEKQMDLQKNWWFQNLKFQSVQNLEVKSKIRNIFLNKKILKEYSVKINKNDSYFCEHYKEKLQVDKNECEYILFRIDVYFTEYHLAVEIDEKNMLAETLFFEEKRQKALKKTWLWIY